MPGARALAALRSDVALRQGWPLLLCAFVYRLCSVGLALLPALAVERGLAPGTASLLLGGVRAAGFCGGLLGGALADRFGVRPPMLFGLALTAVGVGAAGAPLPLAALMAAAPLGALGHACFQPIVRLALTAVVAPEHQRVAVAWMRTGSNLASMFGFALVALAANIGLFPLFLLDAATTAVAFVLVHRLVPDVHPNRGGARPVEGPTVDTRLAFALFSLVMALWVLVYELYMASTAAALARRMPEGGVGAFGALMVVNTVACLALAVPAARRVRRPAVAVPVGLALQAVGLGLAALDPGRLGWALASMTLVTAGEIAVTALSGHLLLVLTPRGAHMGKLYAAQTVALDAGRMAGAALAFPVIVHGAQPLTWAIVLGSVSTIVPLLCRPVWRTYAQLGTLGH